MTNSYGFCVYHEIECDYEGLCIECPHNTKEDAEWFESRKRGRTMSEKLKPCPFCGGTNIHIKDNRTWSYICCYDCLASFWQQEACNVEENIEAWNRRAEQ